MRRKHYMFFVRVPKLMYERFRKDADKTDMSLSTYCRMRLIANRTQLTHPQLRRLRARYWLVDKEMKYTCDTLATDTYLLSNIRYLLAHGKGNNRQLLLKYLPKDRLADCLKRLRDIQIKVTALPNEVNDIEDVYRNINRKRMKGSHNNG